MHWGLISDMPQYKHGQNQHDIEQQSAERGQEEDPFAVED